MKRIALDYTAAYEQGGGIGRYVREIVNALARQPADFEYRLFVSGVSDAKPHPPAPAPHFAWKPTRLSPLNLARIWQRARIPLPIEFFTGRADLYHATDFVLPPVHAPSLLTVHDLSFVRVPETASPPLKRYLDVVVPRSVQRADHVLADSQATKDDLIELYGTPAEKITVLLSGVDARFKPTQNPAVRQKYDIPARPYIFSVGTVQPRKNYVRLIHAVAMLRSRGNDVGLVIAGGKGWLDDPIYAAIQDAGIGEYVQFIGFADDADLPALYSEAHIMALPSLYEGFGFPVIEAMACGTPVLTSTVSSLPEVAGDAAIMVEPTELEAIVDGLERLINDDSLRAALTARGLERARQFTWARTAQQLHEIYVRMTG